VESFAVSDDGVVVAFLTNPSNPATRKPSSIWIMQVDGGAVERFELPVELEASRIVFSPQGVATSGIVRTGEGGEGVGAVFLVSLNGEIDELYRESILATPMASPIASPQACPVAAPEGSPSPRPVTEQD